jgi:uncharacterized protein YkwD
MRRILFVIAVLALLVATTATASAARPLGELIAPTSACADQTDLGDSVGTQLEAMRCMTNYARERSGLAPLGDALALDRSARAKSADIIRCDEFSHEACGREWTYWMSRFGYLGSDCWSAGENIAWGDGRLATVRSIFTGWVHSPPHLENILGAFTEFGLGLKVGPVAGVHAAHVWTQDFGSSC